jgi:hypothetical protein
MRLLHHQIHQLTEQPVLLPPQKRKVLPLLLELVRLPLVDWSCRILQALIQKLVLIQLQMRNRKVED